MQKETRRNSAAGSAKPNPPRKLTRAEKKQIAEIIRQAKGDGKAHTAQQTIPYIQMYPDGICKVTGRKYSKTVAFEDINYQLAQADDKTAIFENWCDFLNYFDASVSVQLSFINQGTQRGEAEKAVNIPAQEDAFNSIRTEYRDMLKNQLAKGNNGLVKAKYITFAIEADSLGAAKSRLARIETDVLNNFKLLGVSARPMTGYERLKMLHGIFHPEGGQFAFDFSWLAPSGLSTKDFIAPSSFRFGEGRYFRMGRKIGAVSFLEILAPELNDRILSDILDLETGVIVNLHIHSIDQTEAIKTIKRKITDLDKMKTEEQKSAFILRVEEMVKEIETLMQGKRIAEPMRYLCSALLAIVAALFLNLFFALWSSRSHKADRRQVMTGLYAQMQINNPRTQFINQTRTYSPVSSGSSGSAPRWVSPQLMATATCCAPSAFACANCHAWPL